MKREEVNPQVKNALGQFIQSTMKTWNGFITQRPILYEAESIKVLSLV